MSMWGGALLLSMCSAPHVGHSFYFFNPLELRHVTDRLRAVVSAACLGLGRGCEKAWDDTEVPRIFSK